MLSTYQVGVGVKGTLGTSDPGAMDPRMRGRRTVWQGSSSRSALPPAPTVRLSARDARVNHTGSRNGVVPRRRHVEWKKHDSDDDKWALRGPLADYHNWGVTCPCCPSMLSIANSDIFPVFPSTQVEQSPYLGGRWFVIVPSVIRVAPSARWNLEAYVPS